MIFDAANLPVPIELKADLCVIGSGAGGSTVAMVAAEAGLKVIVLEPGAFFSPADMTQREEQMLPQLLWSGGNQTTDDKGVRILQGKGVGGSTLHNLNLCKRIPTSLLSRWRNERGMQHLGPDVWEALYDETERLLSVTPIEASLRTRQNQLLEQGCQVLGFEGSGLSHNRTGCVGSGFCELGCAYDAKNNAAKIMMPRAVHAGTEVLTHCQAVRVIHEGGRAVGVEANALEAPSGVSRGSVRIFADKICISASATGTPALLHRSGLGGDKGHVGDTLRVHPAVVAAGIFDDAVHAWRGIPQSYQCTEFLGFESNAKHRIWITPAFAHPVGVATMVPGTGKAHRTIMENYSHLAVFSAMLHDESRGSVRPDGDLGLSLRYWPTVGDLEQLAFGLYASTQLLFAAGARRVLIPTSQPQMIERGSSFEYLRDMRIEKGDIDINAAHPMGTVPMGDDPRKAAVDSRGAHHEIDGLWIGDASLFPSSIGVPPQLSTYAMGLHVGRAIAAKP